jgi:ketosteroid isomerase-like protein
MKRSILLRTGILCFSMLIAAPAFSQSADELKTKIQSLNKEMAKYMLEGNTEKNLGLYTKDAISLPSYEPMLEGIDAIRKANEDMAKAGTKITSFEPTTLKVFPNGNLITEIGSYKITLNVPDMDQPVNDHGKYLTIWEKQKDGSLKIKIETWNSDVNPMMKK